MVFSDSNVMFAQSLVRDIFNRRWNLRLLNDAVSTLDVRYCQIILRVYMNGSVKDWEGGSYG